MGLDNEDERVETADARVKELEAEVTQVGNSLRSMEICEKEGTDRVSSSDSKMIDMEEKYKARDIEATELESKSEELEQQSDARTRNSIKLVCNTMPPRWNSMPLYLKLTRSEISVQVLQFKFCSLCWTILTWY